MRLWVRCVLARAHDYQFCLSLVRLQSSESVSTIPVISCSAQLHHHNPLEPQHRTRPCKIDLDCDTGPDTLTHTQSSSRHSPHNEHDYVFILLLGDLIFLKKIYFLTFFGIIIFAPSEWPQHLCVSNHNSLSMMLNTKADKMRFVCFYVRVFSVCNYELVLDVTRAVQTRERGLGG